MGKKRRVPHFGESICGSGDDCDGVGMGIGYFERGVLFDGYVEDVFLPVLRASRVFSNVLAGACVLADLK